MKSYYRLLDANINRVSEGIRVLEDIARFIYNNEEYSKLFREKRHFLRKLFAEFDNLFIGSREVTKDVGINITKTSTLDKKTNIKELSVGNFKRIQEGLRSLEETLKIIDKYEFSKNIESLRYKFYSLEKEFLNILKNPIPLGIYGITAENFSKGKSNYQVVKEMIEAGVEVIQYREKFKTHREKLKEAKELSKLCKENKVIFIVNDHIDIALMVDADGVHVGQEDLPIEDIRKILGPEKIIGLSTHSIEDAIEATKKDIDYIGVGPIFPTTTKEREAVGLEYLEYVQNNINLPHIAIGGIKESNLSEIIQRGATRVALVSEIVGADNIGEKIEKLKEQLGN